MRTTLKIFLLMLLIIGAIGGILIFAKTRVSPPELIGYRDQYVLNLSSNCHDLECATDFDIQQKIYIGLSDKIKRFEKENVINSEISDTYRTHIDSIFGNYIIEIANTNFRKESWPDGLLFNLRDCINNLSMDRLHCSRCATPSDILSSLEVTKQIIDDYDDAKRLARSSSFGGVDDTKEKMSKALNFRHNPNLQRNIRLMNDLEELPKKLAEAHFKYVDFKVNMLKRYRSVSSNQYKEVLVPAAQTALDEYKEIAYPIQKHNIDSLHNIAVEYINAAIKYYHGN
jgi:hypothetical protein